MKDKISPVGDFKATLATTTQIVWTYIFELTILHEMLNWWSIAGTILILGYMLLVAILKTMVSMPSLQSSSLTPNKDDFDDEEASVS
jgi:drug/metabolite transporter (DMT)-like permease